MISLDSAWAECMTEDGYPTEETLTFVATWKPLDGIDFAPLLNFVGKLWCYPDCYYADPYNRTYSLSTVGWSGNESLVSALQQNVLFWTLCWYSSHRGGKYVFILKEPTQ